MKRRPNLIWCQKIFSMIKKNQGGRPTIKDLVNLNVAQTVELNLLDGHQILRNRHE